MNSNNTLGNRHGSAVLTYPSDTEILITRQFDAPAELVFEAYTTPEHVKRWWGFETSEWVVCEIDLREGGQWRYAVREGEMEVAFHGVYKEVAGPHRVVSTEVYEGAPDPEDNATLNTVTLDEVDGVTTMTVLVTAPSKETRDAIVESGMEGGLQVSYNRMEDLLASLA
jgi:uncharacterized protein YndB with AHSA1/START domain